MQRTVVDGVYLWSVWQPERNLFFNSHFIACSDGNLIVDPLPLSAADAGEIDERGGAAWVLVTNRDHQRDATAFAARFGAKVAAGERDAELLSVAVDRRLVDGATFCGATVIGVPGMKSPGEIALHFPDRRTALVGDALWGDPAGSLRLMPDDKLADPPLVARSLRAVLACDPQHLLVGDGQSIYFDALRALRACLDTRANASLSR